MSGEEDALSTVTAVMQEIQMLSDKLKDDDEEEVQFQVLEKAKVLLECRDFHDAAIVTGNPRRCSQLITQLLYIMNMGDTLSSSETSEVFFGVTKLFQSTDVNLRRMMYLFIKEVADYCNPDDVIIVTSSLVKDMTTSSSSLFTANAMRVLSRIVDATMLSAIERHIKQQIVHASSHIATSALVSSMHLYPTSPEIVRRWINEIQDALLSSNEEMVQFHALALLYTIKQHDRIGVNKIISQLTKTASASSSPLKSSLATVLLIRMVATLFHMLATEHSSASTMSAQEEALVSGCQQYLTSCLRHKSEMVCYEAARVICSLPVQFAGADRESSIIPLQLLLLMEKPVMKFAGVKALSEIALVSPEIALACQDELEHCVEEPNRGIATMAIITLLCISPLSQVEHLLKRISGIISSSGSGGAHSTSGHGSSSSSSSGVLEEELKLKILRAVETLFAKYPSSYRVFIGFLSSFFREEGSENFKTNIVESIMHLTEAVPESLPLALSHLCEFIEDCEYASLLCTVLNFIASSVAYTTTPSQYIRHITNRMVLEEERVRAAAVNAMGQIGVSVPSLRLAALQILRIGLQDECSEVRERSYNYIALLESNSNTRTLQQKHQEKVEKEQEKERKRKERLLAKGKLTTDEESDEEEFDEDFDDEEDDEEDIEDWLDEEAEQALLSFAHGSQSSGHSAFHFGQLALSLGQYVEDSTLGGMDDSPLTLDTLPVVDIHTQPSQQQQSQQQQSQQQRHMSGKGNTSSSSSSSSSIGLGGSKTTSSKASEGTPIASILREDPNISQLLPSFSLFSSSPVLPLTEQEMEYVISYQKHILYAPTTSSYYVCCQFFIKNTIEDQKLIHCFVECEDLEDTIAATLSDPDSFRLVYTKKGKEVDFYERVMLAQSRHHQEQEQTTGGEEKKKSSSDSYLHKQYENSVYLLFELADQQYLDFPLSIVSTLHFNVVQIDPLSGEVEGSERGYKEEFPLENMEISPIDFTKKTYISDFNSLFNEQEAQEATFMMRSKSVEKAVRSLLQHFNLNPCANSQTVTNPSNHTLYLSGMYIGNLQVLMKVIFSKIDARSVQLQMTVQCDVDEVIEMFFNAVPAS